MGERTPRRSINIIFGSAGQLDHKASMARDLNKRASNRLRLHKGSIEGHKTTNLTTLNYEMRQIKHELREITHTSGTFDHIDETIPSRAGIDTARRRKKTRRIVSDRNARNNKNSALSRNAVTDGGTETQAKRNSDTSRRKSVSLPTLPSMTSTAILSPRDPPQLTSRTDISRVHEPIEESFSSRVPSKSKKATQRRQSRRKLSLEARASSGQTTDTEPISVSVIDANGDTAERFRPVSPREASKADSSFVNLNLGAVKDKIQTRLSQPTNPLIDETEDDEEDPDITPYMHVPPDGLPRTVYLLPPLNDLLQEAKKARYLRKPKKPLQEVDMDDPDRELGIDEIFSKKG